MSSARSFASLVVFLSSPEPFSRLPLLCALAKGMPATMSKNAIAYKLFMAVTILANDFENINSYEVPL
jgi:hypothetical protein